MERIENCPCCGGDMSVPEQVLIAAMIFYPTRYQRVILLETYIQQNGPLSKEAGERVRELLEEVTA